jgi:hypothetical protein
MAAKLKDFEGESNKILKKAKKLDNCSSNSDHYHLQTINLHQFRT